MELVTKKVSLTPKAAETWTHFCEHWGITLSVYLQAMAELTVSDDTESEFDPNHEWLLELSPDSRAYIEHTLISHARKLQAERRKRTPPR